MVHVPVVDRCNSLAGHRMSSRKRLRLAKRRLPPTNGAVKGAKQQQTRIGTTTEGSTRDRSSATLANAKGRGGVGGVEECRGTDWERRWQLSDHTTASVKQLIERRWRVI